MSCKIINIHLYTRLELLASINLGLAVLLDSNGVDGDETGGVSGVKVGELVHGGLGGIVELLGLGGSAKDVHATLVESASDLTVDGLLGRSDHGSHKLALGSVVQTVVENLGEGGGDKLVSDGSDLSVHDQTLEINMSRSEDGETGGLVAASGLDSNESVLDNVDSADTVSSSELVSGQEELNGLLDRLVALIDELDGDTLLELDGEVLWCVGGVGGVDSKLPHVLGGSGIGVLKNTSFERDVSQVLIGRPGLSLGLGHSNTLIGSVVEQILSSNKSLDELGVSPGSNDLDIGLKGVERQLESDLVVTLSSAAVGNGEAALLLGNLDLGLSDDGSGQRGTEQVNVLVDGVGLDGGEAQLLNELLSDVLDNELDGADLEGLLSSSLEVLLLANIGHEGNHLVALLNEPGEDHRGIQTSGVGQTDFSLRHCVWCVCCSCVVWCTNFLWGREGWEYISDEKCVEQTF